MKMRSLVLVVVVIILAALPGVVAYAQEGSEGKAPNLLEAISPQLQDLFEAILVVIVPYLAYHVKRWLAQATQQAKSVLTNEQWIFAELVVRNLVHATEQMYGDWEGKEKKAYVLHAAEQMMARYGLDFNMVQIEALLESLVHQELKAPTQVL